MQITASARAKLDQLQEAFRADHCGFHFGKLGGCHTAVPRLKPGAAPRPGEKAFEYDGVTLFMTPREHDELHAFTLDYAKGLFLSRFTLEADCSQCTFAHV